MDPGLLRTANGAAREGELKGELEGELEVESRPAWMCLHATDRNDMHSCMYPNPRDAFPSHGATGGLMVALSLEQREQMGERLLFFFGLKPAPRTKSKEGYLPK